LEKLRGDQAKNAFAQALVVRLKSNLT